MSQDTFRLLDFDGALVNLFVQPNDFKFIDYHNGVLYAFSNKEAYSLNDLFEIEHTYTITSNQNIQKYLWNDNLLYITSQSEIFILDSQLNEQEKWMLEESQQIGDFTFKGDSLLILNNSIDSISNIYWYTSENENGLLASENHPYLNFEHFCKGEFNNTVYGRQMILSESVYNNHYHINGVYSTIEDIDMETPDFSIELQTFDVVCDFNDTITYGDTTYISSLYCDVIFNYTIYNHSNDTLKSCLVQSDNYVNPISCSRFFYTRYFEDLMIPPNGAVSISEEKYSVEGWNSLCLYLLAANKQYDTQFENNQSCILNVGLSEVSKNATEVKLYPNPTKDFLNLNTNKHIAQIQIIDLEGKEYPLETTAKNSYNIAHLPRGLYLLQIVDKEGRTQNAKFVKKKVKFKQ